MEEIFWFNSWELTRNYPGFRRQDIHPYALKYLTPFLLEGKSVFVPFNKSPDLLYFSHFAFQVIGVESSEEIILQFFEENKRTYKRIGNRFVSGNITFFCCDFISLTSEALGKIDIVYDRASPALLSRSPGMNYRRVLDRLIPAGAMAFLLGYPSNEVIPYFQNYVIDHVEKPAPFNFDSEAAHSFQDEHAFLMHKLYDKPLLTYSEKFAEALV